MSGIRSSGGLICSHGSDLDMRIPRAKMPSRALPDCLRKKLGFGKGKDPNRRASAPGGRFDDSVAKEAEQAAADEAYRTAGAGVLVPREAVNGHYAAGSQKHFLKRGSGVPMSRRASRVAQTNQGMEERVSEGVAGPSILNTASRTSQPGGQRPSVSYPTRSKKRRSSINARPPVRQVPQRGTF